MVPITKAIGLAVQLDCRCAEEQLYTNCDVGGVVGYLIVGSVVRGDGTVRFAVRSHDWIPSLKILTDAW